MKFVVLFQDSIDADPGIRKAHMSAHLDFLDKNGVEAAGPLADPDNSGRDGLWILDAKSISDVDALVRQDPFWPTGLRASYSIIPWTQVYRDGKRLIQPPTGS